MVRKGISRICVDPWVCILLLSAVLVLSGCATNYKSTGLSGGFSETQLAENVWSVRFKGNGYTSREKSSEFCLLRCADVCLDNGYNYFVLVDQSETAKVSTHVQPSTSYTTGSAYTLGNTTYGNATTHTYGGSSYNMSKPRSNNTIMCFKDKPAVNAIVYEAKFIQKSLRDKWKMSD